MGSESFRTSLPSTIQALSVDRTSPLYLRTQGDFILIIAEERFYRERQSSQNLTTLGIKVTLLLASTYHVATGLST